MRVLVTGGAGALGVNLLRYLRRYPDWSVRSLDIAPLDGADLTHVDGMVGDIRDREVVARAMHRVDVVVNAAAALPSYRSRDIWSIDVDGTGTLLEEAVRHGVSRFVHVSSTAVYGLPRRVPVVECDPLTPVDSYSRAKIEAERVCARYRQRGLCVPILRPKSFIGPERLGLFAMLYQWAYEGRSFPILGQGRNRYQFLDVDDLSQAVVQAVTAPAAVANDTFNVAAAEFRTIREDFQAVLDEAGHGRKIVCLPAVPALLALRALELTRLSPLYQRLYRKLTDDSYVSVEKAQRRLGLRPRYSNAQALVRSYRWYVRTQVDNQRAPGVTHRAPWKLGMLRMLKPLF